MKPRALSGSAIVRIALVHLLTGAMLVAPHAAAAQTQAEVWRTFAATLAPGTPVQVRLTNGQRFRATLIGVRDDAVLLLPRTRVPVDVQPVSYDAIAFLQERTEGRGVSPTRAAVIGVASGAATFFALLWFVVSALD